MRKYAWLKEPHKSIDNIWKIMLYKDEEGVFLFTYSSPDAIQCTSDFHYDSLEDLYDAFIPIRVKGRDIGKPEWGKYEIFNEGKWVEYKPIL